MDFDIYDCWGFNASMDSSCSLDDEQPGKIFVGGINPHTTTKGLRYYFSKFGPIKDVMIMRDAKTGMSRCFGFVVFSDPFAVDIVLSIKEHYLDGKKIDPKKAVRLSPARSVHNVHKKLFMGGVSKETTVEDLKAYFSKYGEIEDVILKLDYPSKIHRGFGFLTFADEGAASIVCKIHYHTVNGKKIEVKPAEKKEVVKSKAPVNPLLFSQLVDTANNLVMTMLAAQQSSPPPRTDTTECTSKMQMQILKKYCGVQNNSYGSPAKWSMPVNALR